MFPNSLNSKFRSRVIALPFVAIWIIYFAGFAVFFPQNLHGSLLVALSLQALFALIILVPFLHRNVDLQADVVGIRNFEFWFVLGLILIGFTAAAALLYDRMLQGIDYGAGVCGAREQMNRIGEARTGISSVYSFFGLLFGYFYFAALPIIFMRKVGRGLFWGVLLTSFILLMSQSILTASRFATLIYVLMLIVLAGMRLAKGAWPRVRIIDVALAVVILAAAGGFVVNEFSCRANLSHLNGEQYAESFTEHLLIPTVSRPPNDPVEQAGSSGKVNSVENVLGLFKITAYYGIHSGFAFAAIIDTEPRAGLLSLSGPLFLLAKVGLNFHPAPISEVISGRFVSLPGSIYYDAGWVGLVVFSLALSAFFAWIVSLHKTRPSSLLISSILACLLVVLYISPITLAINIMHFPFIVFAMLAAPIALAIFDFWIHKAR